jgi:RimJ/RimL family protein N-acetyltransferase
MIVRLETPRLVIRTFTLTDGPAWVEVVNDPDVRRLTIGDQRPGLAEFEAVVGRGLHLGGERGFAIWAVELRETGAYIGQCGFYLSEAKGPGIEREVELGYAYLPATWGQGLGTEAALAVLTYGFGTLGLDEVIAVVVRDNVASSRVCEKAGLQLITDEATYYNTPHLLKYAASREPWLAAHPTS